VNTDQIKSYIRTISGMTTTEAETAGPKIAAVALWEMALQIAIMGDAIACELALNRANLMNLANAVKAANEEEGR
jgi:hypothetical protein